MTSDFIFGTLGTDERRLRHLKDRQTDIWHGSRTTPIDPVPGDDVTFAVVVGTEVSATSVELLLARDGSFPDGGNLEVIPFTLQSTTWSTLAWGYVQTWECTMAAKTEELWRYRIRGTTHNGDTLWADVSPLTGDPGLFSLSIDNEKDAAWLNDAVIYQVFVDRFAPEHSDTFGKQSTLMDIWGGTINGVRRHLDHIHALGTTAIWLTPIFPSPTHHGYDVTDYQSVEPRLGTLEDFDSLVQEARSKGMRIILDFVASHVSNEHPRFQDGLANPESVNRDLFIINEDETYESFFGVQSMPRINGDNDTAAQWLIDAALFWVDRGVDGFRLDYSIGQSYQFWTRFRRELRKRNPDVALIAEAVDSPENLKLYQGRIDGVLDFSFLQRIREFIGFDTASADDFWRFFERHQAWFKDGPIPVTFLDNHDMNRFLWIAQGDTRRLKIAALLQMSLPSPAAVYYGTEVGLNQWHDLEYPDGSRRLEESRTPMLWGAQQNRELKEFYRSLIFWRKKFEVTQAIPRLVHAGDDGLLIYTVGSWLVAINRSDEEVGIDLGSYGSMWLSLATDNGVKLYGSELVIPAYGGAVLANELAR